MNRVNLASNALGLGLALCSLAPSTAAVGWIEGREHPRAERPDWLAAPRTFRHDAAARRPKLRPALPPVSSPGDEYWSDAFGRAGLDGPVHALANYDGLLVAGGDFTISNSTALNHIARWDGLAWEPLGAGLGSSCSDWRTVGTLVVHEGLLIAGGSFVEAGCHTVNGLAQWDGAGWTGVGGGVGRAPGYQGDCARVNVLASFEGDLIVGGSFERIGGQPIANIARRTGGQWEAMGAGYMGEVRALAVCDGELIVGCHSYTLSGTSNSSVLRWDGSEWRPLGQGPNGFVTALVEYGGELIAAGGFEQADGVPAAHIARWDGAVWSPLGSGLSGGEYSVYPYALAVYRDTLFVGGEFARAGEVAASGIASWDGSEWSCIGAGLQTGLMDEVVYALHASADRLVAGGHFDRSGNTQTEFAAAWNGAAWEGFGTPGLGADGLVTRAVEHAGTLVFTGSFSQVGDVLTQQIARWHGNGWEKMDQGFAAESTHVVALASDGIELYASRNHDRSYIDSTGSQVMRWQGGSWLPLGPAIDRYIECMTVYAGELVVAGRFARAGTTAANSIASWDGSQWQALGSGILGDYPEVRSLLVYQGDLYAAGTFSWAGEGNANNIARWDGKEWHPLGGGLTGLIYANVYGMAPYEGKLIAVGDFSRAGDVPANSVAAWDGERWLALGDGLPGEWDMPGLGTCAAAQDKDLYVGGIFDRAGGAVTRNIAHWDGSEWSALGSGLNEVPICLAFHDNRLYTGGWFTSAGGKQSARVACWSGPIVPIAVSDLSATTAGGRVRLAWRLAREAIDAVHAVHVERARVELGPYEELTPVALVPRPHMEFTDAEAGAGAGSWYRIVLELHDGSRSFAGPVTVREAPGVFLRTRLESVLDAGAGAPVQIRYTVGPAVQPVSLAVYDVRGHEVWSRPAAMSPPGEYMAVWNRCGNDRIRVARGVYFVGLTAPGVSCNAKLVLVRP